MEEAKAATVPPISLAAAVSNVRISGAWSGVIEVQLEAWTLPMLRQEVARRAAASSDCVNLICGGKFLRDDDPAKPLAQLGFRNNSKVLATVVQGDRGKAINKQADAQAEHAKKLARIQDAAKALAERHADGTLPLEDYNIELEDQNGQKVMFGSEADKKALMMGLMLHTNARSLIGKQKFKEALDVLYMGEEAFSLCDPKLTEIIDNVPILQLDIVWCHFMLQDISHLAVAGIRLVKARKGFEHSHGKDSMRLRHLQAGYQAELAIYLRMELLEGVVAYHCGNFKEARKALSSAQVKYVQLQVPDEALSMLMGMGYKEKAAKRALRMTGQDVQLAVDFLVEEQARKMRRKQEEIWHKLRFRSVLEQKRYGATPRNKPVNLQELNNLVSIGFERDLAAEALRVNENDAQKALDLLTDPEKNCALQSQLEKRKKSRTSQPTEADVEGLTSIGYDRSSVMDAVQLSRTKDDALEPLAGAHSENNQHAIRSQTTDDQEGPSAVADSHNQMDKGVGQESPKYQRDEVMEDELAKEVTGDPLVDYDIEVTKEGEAIAEYLALLDSDASAI
ncbi:UBA [Musa troglodytarum]|uniref:UBA n=1 Tax=Musa troglodytarum TaxID=320322 RepID=A0A9E7LDA4_9LILI|nr:UBA [Musa troglodytarum]URE49311.1 UBA [Musa troglodytarum]